MRGIKQNTFTLFALALSTAFAVVTPQVAWGQGDRVSLSCSSLLSQGSLLAYDNLRALYAETFRSSQQLGRENPDFGAEPLLSAALEESLHRLAQSPKNPQVASALIHRLQDLRDQGYPYMKTLRALGAVVFFAEKGALLPEEANDSSILDPVLLNKNLEASAAQISELYETDMIIADGLRGRIFYLPTYESLNFEDINLMLAANIHPLGMSFKTNYVDGIKYLPVGMLLHDALHSAQIFPGTSKTSHLYKFPAQEKLARFFDRALNQLSLQQRYLVHAIVFQVVHEEGRPYSDLLTSLKYEEGLKSEVKTTLKLDRQNRPTQLRVTDRALASAWNWILEHFPKDL